MLHQWRPLRLMPAVAAQGTHGPASQPQREEDRQREHRGHQPEQGQRGNDQDQQGQREREDLDRQGGEAGDERAGLSGEV